MACKVMKKGLVGAGLAALALGLLFGSKAPSYVKTAFHKVRHNVDRSVPIQFEIDRARSELADLKPAIEQNIENVARAEEDVKELRSEIVAFRTNLDRETRDMLALRRELGSGDIRRTGATYTEDEVKKELKGRLDHCRQSQRTLSEMEKTLRLKEDAVKSARLQLKSFIEQKVTLEREIDEVEARQRSIEVARTTNEFRFDDSALGKVKQTIKELKKRQNIEIRKGELEGKMIDKSIDVAPASNDVLKEIDQEFGADTGSRTVTDKNL